MIHVLKEILSDAIVGRGLTNAQHFEIPDVFLTEKSTDHRVGLAHRDLGQSSLGFDEVAMEIDFASSVVEVESKDVFAA